MNRDISIVKLNQREGLVIACDSLGGIGSKRADQIKAPNEIVGRFTLRVALMEILAVKATPISVINTLSVEYEPTGREIISGIRAEMEVANLATDKLLNGSTEENIPVQQTGMGVTVIGRTNLAELKSATSSCGDLVIAIGEPNVGEEVLVNKDKIADLQVVKSLAKLAYINEILPVGSQGIKTEAQLLASLNNLELKLNNDKLNLDKSAGPATVLLVTSKEENLAKLKQLITKPISIVGYLK